MVGQDQLVVSFSVQHSESFHVPTQHTVYYGIIVLYIALEPMNLRQHAYPVLKLGSVWQRVALGAHCMWRSSSHDLSFY